MDSTSDPGRNLPPLTTDPRFLGFLLFVTCVGALCLFHPTTVQRLAIRLLDRGWLPRNKEELIRSAEYLRHMRIAGAIALGMAVFLTVAGVFSR